MNLDRICRDDIKDMRARGNELNAASNQAGAYLLDRADVMQGLLDAANDQATPNKYVAHLLNAIAHLANVTGEP